MTLLASFWGIYKVMHKFLHCCNIFEQGDRTKKVGVVDSEYIFHKGIQTLGGGGPPGRKVSFFFPSLPVSGLSCSLAL